MSDEVQAAPAEAEAQYNGKLASVYEALRNDETVRDADNGTRLALIVGEDVPGHEVVALADAALGLFSEFAHEAATGDLSPEDAVRGGLASVVLLGMELGFALKGGAE